MRGTASRTIVGRVVTGGVLVALVLGATAVPGTARTAAKPTGDPVKVMVIYEKSAGIASPEIPDGAIAAAKAFNKQDGIGKRPVKVLVCDTTNDPNVAGDCGQQAISEGVVALIGVLTPYSGSFMPLMAQNKVASIGNVLASADDFQSSSSFPITGGIVATSANLPRFLADEGAKTISVARPDLAAGAIIKLFGNTALAKVGQSIKNDVPVPTDAPDMSTYVQAALAGGTDGIIVALPGQQAINFVQAAKQADPKVKLAIISTEPGPVQKALGADAAGIIQGPAYLPVPAKGNAEAKRYVKEMKAAGYKDTSGFRINSWTAMQVLKSVADKLPEVTAAGVFDQLGQTTDLETGLTPPLQWTTPADVGVSLVKRVFNNCELAVAMTGKSGKVKPVTGKFFDAFTGQDCPTP